MTPTDPARSAIPDVVKPAPPATPLRPLPATQADKAASDNNSITVKPARIKSRHILALYSFIALVVLPVAAVGYYMAFTATDQYQSKTAFSIIREDPNTPVSSLLGGLPSVSSGTSETDVLYQFIQSHDLVAILDAELDLRRIFSRQYDSDPVFGMPPDASTEDLQDFWNKMVAVRIENKSGIISVETKSFTAEDGFAINNAILTHSRALVEKISAIAQEDTIRFAQEQVTTATERLKNARLRIAEFRRTSQIIDPNADAASQMGVLNQLETKLADAMIELELLLANTSAINDPRITQAELKITAIRNRIEAERAAAVSQGATGEARNGALSSALADYEAMLLEQEFSEQAYINALSSFDSALAEAQRKSRYLVAHISPSLAQTPEYPQRFVIWAVLSVFILLTWVLLVLVAYSLRDRR